MLDAQRSAAPSMGDGRILLVDDDRDLLSSLRDLLEPEGYEVATASDPEGARRIAAEFRPDIALLDVKLGSANGIELIPILKERLPGIACVVMTAFAATENAVQAMRNGADDYLNKPIDPANLMRALNRCRQHQRLEREKRAVVAALRDSEERIRAIMENVADALVTIDDKGIVESINPAAQRLFGFEPQEIIGQNVSLVIAGLERDQHQTYIENYLRSGEGKILGKGPREVKARHKDGTEIDVELAVSKTRVGDKLVFIGAMRDITERKRLEGQLRQAQKMEAVGQLTGGVAHDFNNLLGVILGNAELLEDRLGVDDKQVQAVIRAAGRGAELTQRLLAFSRLQPLQPKALDPAALIAGLSDLLSRTLGETISIEIKSAADLWMARADPGQLESALLNLAINSGQAMPGGGTLTIETANATIDEAAAAANNAEPGAYVMVAVTDTGTGMTDEVMERAFEPFFTTKDVGEGSGLGLSMVYGFAQQSGGFVSIESEADRGTTLRLYLPRAEGELVVADKEPDDVAAPGGHGETILVVEDDPAVRSLAVTLLENLGYQVLAAPDAMAALSFLHAPSRIDLVLSDVMLPGGMCGPDLVEEAKRLRPDLRVLFMSGYTEHPARGSGPLYKTAVPEAAAVLNKPFRKRDLARRLRAALGCGPA
ncbi:MAG: response regulator [Proteobacteria bacterium]|nr:response regulator [Pseudomonadota bacterium]